MNKVFFMKTNYQYIIVESFYPESTAGRHGPVHIRPIPGQDPFLPEMYVECSKELSNDYPVGTKFRIKAKITNRLGGPPFVYSSFQWAYEVLAD